MLFSLRAILSCKPEAYATRALLPLEWKPPSIAPTDGLEPTSHRAGHKEISGMPQDVISRPSRRRIIGTGAAALALGGLAAPPFVRKANAQSQFDWKRAAGQKIDVIL